MNPSPSRLYRRGTVMVFEDIDLIDLEGVPGLYPSARGRLFDLLDDLDDDDEPKKPDLLRPRRWPIGMEDDEYD